MKYWEKTKNIDYFLLLFIFTVFCASLLQGMIDPDFFWHIRGGMDILENGKIVLKDSWNYIYEGKEWVNQQWLIEVVFATIYKFFGINGVFYFKAFSSSLIALFLFLALKREKREYAFISVSIIIAVIGRYFLMRTQLFSFLFLSILLFLLEKIDLKKRVFPLIALFVLWVNIHAFFGIGLLVLGCFVVSKELSQIFKEKSIAILFKKDNLLLDVQLFLSFLATFLNPFGIKVYLTSHSLFSQRQEMIISEWLSVFKYPLVSNLIFFIFFGILVFISILFIEKIKLYEVAISLPLIMFGLYSVRILPLSVIASSILFHSLMTQLFDYLKIKDEAFKKLSPLFISLLLIFSLSSLSFRVLNPVYVKDTKYREDYPVGAIAFMKENNLKGKIFNEFDWGGYIVFCSKEFKTAIDGRTAVLLFAEDELIRWRDCVDLNEGYIEYLERNHPDYVLLYADDFLANALLGNPNWQLLYADGISALFGRKFDN